MQKISILIVGIILSGLLSYGQHANNTYNKLFHAKKTNTQNPVYQSQYRGTIYPHKALVYGWNSISGTWESDHAQRFAYAPDGKLMYDYEMAFDFSDTNSRQTTIFDYYGYLTEESYDYKMGPNDWKKFYGTRSVLDYYNQNKLALKTDEDWNQDRVRWVNSYKTTYTHDGTGLLTNYVEEEWDTMASDWSTAYKYEFLYDGSNKNNEIIGDYWDGSSWQKEMKVMVSWYKFNPYVIDEMDIDSAIMLEWNPDSSKYIKSERIKISRDANGGYVQNFYVWQDEWVPSERMTVKNDAQGNMISDKGEQWNGSSWDIYWDAEYNLTYVSGNVTEKIERGKDQGDTAYQNRWKYVYSDFTSIKDSRELNFRVYPVPFSNYLNIELPDNKYQNSVTITDLNGKILISQILPKNTILSKIDVSGLNSGAFILSVQNQNSRYSRLVIKK